MAIVSLPYADGFNLAVELRPTGGEGRKVSGDEVDLAIDARAVCAHRECDMEAIGTILVSSTEVTVAQTVNWSVLLAVEPVDAQVDLTDFTVEILEHDGGVASP